MSEERTPGALGSNDELGLVERLRQERIAIYRLSPMAFLKGAETDLRDAADEIERLRFELGYAQGQINQAEADKAKAVAAERERWQVMLLAAVAEAKLNARLHRSFVTKVDERGWWMESKA